MTVPPEVRQAAEAALADEPAADRTVLLARLDRHWPDLLAGLTAAYGDRAPALAAEVAGTAVAAFVRRPADLRLLDLQRHVSPDWFQAPGQLGYACYAERFGGDLQGVGERVGYLRELGVTYLHLLPLLQPRPGQDDGGYAVMDHRSVRPDLGTVEDLAALAARLRGEGVSLVLDLVLNHVAREHDWAVRARAGDERYRRYFHVFADRSEPDAFEATLPEVFPDFAPGSFSWDDELQAWVWTTFHDFQWDLNWHEPAVFGEFAAIVCDLANLGVECLRLDAIAFLWKRLGTDCQNQPEVHALTAALRAVARIAAPALVFKAEAIVAPDQLAHYLGTGPHTGKVSDLAYHNSLMVQVWSALAAADARLLVTALGRFPPKPATAAWATYLRCHDDIGWAVDDRDAEALAWTGPGHRSFLADFYAGDFPGSAAEGLVFQHNAETGDRRTSGTAASLAGLAAARRSGDEAAVDLAVQRLLLAHLLVLGYGGVPLLWSGDELALPNDEHWADEPGHEGDNRWAHRPRLPWDVAERRHEPGTVEARVFGGLAHAAAVRARLPAMHAAVESELLHPVNPAVVGWVRRAPAQVLVALHNVSAEPQLWPRDAVPLPDPLVDALSGGSAGLVLPPYGCLWLVDPPPSAGGAG